MSGLAFLLIAAVTLDAKTHAEANPVYAKLRQMGVPIAEDFSHVFTAPTMADGMSPEAQKERIEQVIGHAYEMRTFLRKSVVAPYVLHMDTVDSPDPQKPYRQVDLWFVAYGTLETVASEEFLQRLLDAGEEDAGDDDQGHELTAAELANRGILVKAEDSKFERHAHGIITLLDRVRLATTSHAFWSRTSDSILFAVTIDSRFGDDPEFPNLWRSITRNDLGNQVYGSPEAYQGAAMYAKITRLAHPEGALFVECHVVFCEPFGWFDGQNLLGSKLPPILQSRVRNARRELIKASRNSSRPISTE